jgi:hypothetical protein
MNEDTKAKVKEFEKKLRECLDDSNFILQGEDDDKGIGRMVEDGVTLTEEENDDMIVEEHPKPNDEEALDKYLNMELRMCACQNR